MRDGAPLPNRETAATGPGVPALDPDSPLPLYQQIVAVLTSRITGGEWIEGARLPGEHEMAEAFGVSRITAKRALDELAAAGLVKRERGRGTRVLAQVGPPPVCVPVADWLQAVGHMQRTTGARLLDFAYLPAPSPVASALGLAASDEALRTVRVRTLDGAPMSHLTAWLPGRVGRHLSAADLEADPLLKLLERAGIAAASARQTVSATLAPPDIAQALGLYAGAPLLEVRRIVNDEGGAPVQYLHALYHPERYQLAMTMTRVAGDGGMEWSSAPAAPVHAGGEE